jgi:hypothetical protein
VQADLLLWPDEQGETGVELRASAGVSYRFGR